MSSRRVVVDDTDPQIRYTGAGWLPNNGSQDNIGHFGSAYQNTLHGTNMSGSLSFSFQGTNVVVMGSNNAENTPDVHDPTWDCFVDNISIGANPFQARVNNHKLCNTIVLEDGLHELIINITATGQMFWLDSIQYLPSFFEHSVLHINHTDPNIIYDSGWRATRQFSHITQTSSSTASFNFKGTRLSWIGLVPKHLSHIPSQGTYSIDGGPQIPFPLNGLPPGNGEKSFESVFFSTPKLSDRPHTLRVTYQGNSSQMPLTLKYLSVEIPRPFINPKPPGCASPSAGTSQPNAVSTSSQPNGDHVGAIVGGVVGGVFLVIVCLGFLWWYRRRRRYASLRNPTVTWSPDSKVDPTMRAYSHGAQVGGTINPSLPSLDAKEPEKSYHGLQPPQLMLQHTASRRLSSDTVLSGYGSETMMQTREFRKYNEAPLYS